GLAMVKGLVDLHGGTATIASPGLGRGTTITVKLPIVPAPAAEEHVESAHAVPHYRVLVIEDNADVAETLRDALEVSGQEVAVAYDGPSGIARAREFRPEVVLCDIGLPGMDGYAVARAFRSADDLKNTHLVALTGYALSENVGQAAEAGFDRHVAKP